MDAVGFAVRDGDGVVARGAEDDAAQRGEAREMVGGREGAGLRERVEGAVEVRDLVEWEARPVGCEELREQRRGGPGEVVEVGEVGEGVEVFD